jgi:pimeloyl-ACP methyl ester carboxylesterase
MIITKETSSPYCLFFLHGMLCDANDWQLQLDYFSKQHQVIACDIPGHGSLLDKSHDVSFDVVSLANYFAKIINSLEISKKIVLIAHSASSRIAIELSFLLKDRVGGLILLDMDYQNSQSYNFSQMKKDQQAIVGMGYQSWLDSFFDIKLGSTTPAWLRDQVMKKAFKSEEGIGIEFYLNIKSYDYYSLKKSLYQLNSPLFILQSSFYSEGKRQEVTDDNTPASDWLSLVSETLPETKIKVVKNCGHWILLQKPGLSNAFIDKCLKLINSK